MILMYDLEDNYIMEFKNTKECAEYFNTNRKCIDCHLCKFRQGKIKKKRDFKHNRWVRLYRCWSEDE